MVSSAKKSEILQNISLLDPKTQAFDLILSSQNDLNSNRLQDDLNKPNPAIYRACAQMLNLDPGRCLVFEDSYAGVIAGTKAGMDIIAVPNECTRQHDFSSALGVTSFQEWLSIPVEDYLI